MQVAKPPDSTAGNREIAAAPPEFSSQEAPANPLREPPVYRLNHRIAGTSKGGFARPYYIEILFNIQKPPLNFNIIVKKVDFLCSQFLFNPAFKHPNEHPDVSKYCIFFNKRSKRRLSQD